MKKNKIVSTIIISLVFIFILIQSTHAEVEIPSIYYQDLNLDNTYIYEVAAFNTSEHLEWANLDWTSPSKGYANTTPYGQIIVNINGFYDKDPNDYFNIFENPMPYMDIEFVVNRSGILFTNTTFYNVSNGEVAQNLLLGYNKFKPGFLIPINDLNNLKQQAESQDEPPFMNATVIVQESAKTISFEFHQKTFMKQKTVCIYDKRIGLLTYTNTTFGNYFLEMSLAETEIPNKYYQDLNYDDIYVYEVAAFNTSEHLEWADLDWTSPSKGYASTTPYGQIKVNINGFYDKDPNDYFNIFENPIPYMDIEFVVNRSGILITNTTFYHISNGEAAQNLLLGYNKFKSGFLIPINDLNNLTQQAENQDEPPFMNATVLVQDSATTISFEFHQKTYLKQKTVGTYDKRTGLLIYANTTFGNYFLEMSLTNHPHLPSDSISIPSFQLFIVILTSSTAIIIIIHSIKRDRRKL